MKLLNPDSGDFFTALLTRLKGMQDSIRDHVVRSREALSGFHDIARSSQADTIYKIDSQVDPILLGFCDRWADETGPLVLVAEGLEDDAGQEVASRILPKGARDEQAAIRVIVDPIDGTRGLMYDKRAAWSLAGVAPNRGPKTRLADIVVAAMTELPTSKQGSADQLWAVRGQGAHARRIDLRTGATTDLPIRPSQSDNLNHGFASVTNFFPGTKVLAAELMEHLARHLLDPADLYRATLFDDQYISTAGQWYELIVGHDRFNADLRPAFYKINSMPEGMCCHPYDCAAALIAQEAGVILTDAQGAPLDGPFDTTTGMNWIGYANSALREKIEPLVMEFLRGSRAREP